MLTSEFKIPGFVGEYDDIYLLYVHVHMYRFSKKKENAGKKLQSAKLHSPLIWRLSVLLIFKCLLLTSRYFGENLKFKTQPPAGEVSSDRTVN
jgi:hypothetical protein